MPERGIVVKFDPERGYGFIRFADSEGDAFVHIRDVEGRVELVPGQQVTCDLAQTRKGVEARNVKPGSKAVSPGIPFLAVAVLIVGASLAIGGYGSVPWIVSGWTGVNLATVALYAYDKGVAGGRRLRVPESVLHLMAACGGTPAAFLSQRLFRHKTLKGRFQAIFWLIAILQFVLLGVWLWCWRTRPEWIPEMLLPRSVFPL